jgi:hypothetical protein
MHCKENPESFDLFDMVTKFDITMHFLLILIFRFEIICKHVYLVMRFQNYFKSAVVKDLRIVVIKNKDLIEILYKF